MAKHVSKLNNKDEATFFSLSEVWSSPAPSSRKPEEIGRNNTATSPNEESGALATYDPLTDYEPNVLDDFHYSKTSAMILQDESGDIDTEPSYSCDAEFDDELIGKALSSPLFIQERDPITVLEV